MHRYSVDLFSYYGPSEIFGSDGKLKPVLVGVTIVSLPIRTYEHRLNKTKSVVFLYCRFSLFLKDLFFQIICQRKSFSRQIVGEIG